MRFVSLNPWKHPETGKIRYYVVLQEQDGKPVKAVVFSPKGADFKPGDEVPADWKLEPGRDGKDPILGPPRQQGTKGQWKESWSQSEDGQRFQAERSDRRTALMQAMEFVKVIPPTVTLAYKDGTTENRPRPLNVADVKDFASGLYRWLQETVSGKAADTLAFGEGTSGSKASPDGAEVSADASAPPRSEDGHGAQGDPATGSLPHETAASDIVPFGPFSGKTFTEWAQANPGTLRSVLRANSLNAEQKEKAEKALQAVGA